MSKTSIVVILAIAAALAAGAYFALQSSQNQGTNVNDSGQGIQTLPVLSFSPAEVVAVSVTTSNRTERAVRSSSGAWTYQSPDAWPIDTTLVNSALSSIAELQALALSSDTESPSLTASDALTVTIDLQDGSSHTVTLSRQTAGGRAQASVDSTDPVIIPAAALGLFDPSQGYGPASWRVRTSSLPGAHDAPTRIRVSHDNTSYTLERTTSGWFFSEPFRAPAPNAPDVLRALVSDLSFVDFSPARALFPPTITIRSASGTRSIGLSSESASPTLATVSLPGITQNIRIEHASPVSQILDPTRFLSPVIIEALPGDIRVIGTATDAYEQTLDGWVDDSDRPLVEPVSLSIDQVLQAMTDGSATPIILDNPDSSDAFITLVSRTGKNLGTFTVVQLEAGLRVSQGRIGWILPESVIAPWLNARPSGLPNATDGEASESTLPNDGTVLPEK